MRTTSLLTAVVALSLFASSAFAQGVQVPQSAPATPETASEVDPAAFIIFKTMVESMRGLKALSASIEVDSNPASVGRSAITGLIDFKRPNDVRIDVKDGFGSTIETCDGKQLSLSTVRDDTRYTTIPVNANDDMLIESLSLAGINGSGLLPSIFSSGIDVRPEYFTSLVIDPSRNVNGVSCVILRGVMHMGSGDAPVLFAIGQGDHLLRKDVMNVVELGGSKQMTDSLTDIKADPDLPDSLFVYSAPQGAIKTTAIDPGTYDPSLRIGTKVFSLDAVDNNGRPIDLAQFRGHVVLVDYWASWCRWCLLEMPDIRAMYQKYHRQGFDVITISCDDDNTVDAMRGYLHQNPFPWHEIYDGQGMDSDLVTRYNISALPFGILIGPDGSILRVAPRGDMLANDLAKAYSQ